MKRTLSTALMLLACAAGAYGQGKGIDRQNERVRDAGTNRQPGVNGGRQDYGTGRGIDFGGRKRADTGLPNPLRVAASRDDLMRSVEEVMRERKLILDAAASNRDAGVFVSQPYTFSRGALVTDAEVTRYAQFAADDADRNFTRARYTLVIEVQMIDGISANVSANARVEARGESVAGPEWVSLPSSGAAEQEFLVDLTAKLNDVPATVPTQRP